MAFFRGQRVVCVDAGPTGSWLLRDLNYPQPLVLHQIYTIRGFSTAGGVYLLEITLPEFKGEEIAHRASRFRPVVSKSTEAGMKQLRSLLTDAPEKVEA